MSIRPEVKHGIVMSVDEGREKYFAWPSVAKLADGTVVVSCSGLRASHLCPWGKTVVAYSADGGETFSAPQVVHNDRADNRDSGVTAMGGQKFAVAWFSSDMRRMRNEMRGMLPKEYWDEADATLDALDNDTVKTLMGSWIKITEDGGKTWTRAIRVPVSAPHGFSMLNDGETLGYLGKGYREDMYGTVGPVQYCESRDGGCTWQIVGEVKVPEPIDRYWEPHVIQLKDGTLLGAIRYHGPRAELGNGAGYEPDILITRSADGGRTWSEPQRLYTGGLPPHLLQHSSGAVVVVYGYRHEGYGQRARVSRDNGVTWSDEIILRDDGYNFDLGYPASIELDDGSVYTVYYQAKPGVSNTSIMWSRWKLPEN